MSKVEHVRSNKIALEKETSNNLVVDSTNVSEGFPDSLDFYNTSQSSESINNITHGVSPSGLVESHQPDDHSLAIMPCSGSSFPKSAQMFVDAIKKNRACQKFLRSKLMQIEARIEENKTLKQRVKLLRDFQVSCKKRTGRALSQKKDARVQLISAIKPRANSKVNLLVNFFLPLIWSLLQFCWISYQLQNVFICWALLLYVRLVFACSYVSLVGLVLAGGVKSE